jgi:hypothetical protein
VFILKGDEVVCFDVVLQVLILNVDAGGVKIDEIGSSGEKNRTDVAPISRVFAYEWQGKELRDRECVKVANKGLAGRPFCASRARQMCNSAFGRIGIMVRRADRNRGGGRRVDAEIEKERAELVGGEGCAAVMTQDTGVVN